MYTGTPTRDWQALSAQGAAAVQRAEAGFPWEQAAPRSGTDQETWLISFIDILTLLLTLFVLLLAYQQHDDAPQTAQPAVVAVEQGTMAAKGLPATASGEHASTAMAAVLATLPAQAARPAVLNEVAATATAETSVAEPLSLAIAAQADYRPSLQIKDDSGSDSSVAAVQTHPLLWLAAMSAVDSAPEQPTATPTARPEPIDAPQHRLLDELERSALAGRVEVTVLADAVNLEISDNILFTPASAALTAGGRRLLDELAATLKTLPYALSVEGHTDNVPIRSARYPSNWELASARAGTVTRHLIGQGIAAERVRAIGYADTRPRTGNTSPEGRARNRRVSFVLRMPVS